MHHLKNDLGNEKSTVLLTGYQAENTLGRKLESGAKRVKVLGEELEVKARIMKLDQLSAHADRSGLLRYVKNIKSLKKLCLVHGENEARFALAELIKKELPGLEVYIPNLEDSFEI